MILLVTRTTLRSRQQSNFNLGSRVKQAKLKSINGKETS